MGLSCRGRCLADPRPQGQTAMWLGVRWKGARTPPQKLLLSSRTSGGCAPASLEGSLEGTWSLGGWDRKPTRSQPGCVSAETRQSQAFLSFVSSLLLVCNCPDPRAGEELRLCWPDRLGDTQDSGHTCDRAPGTPAIPSSGCFICRNSVCLGAEPRGALPQPPGTPLTPLTAWPRVPRPALPRTNAGPPDTRWLAQRMRLWLWLLPRGLCVLVSP